MYCKQCGKEIPSDARFCASCGSSQLSPPTKPVCSACGHELLSDRMAFCPFCGAKVNAQPTPIPYQPPVAPTQPTPYQAPVTPAQGIPYQAQAQGSPYRAQEAGTQGSQSGEKLMDGKVVFSYINSEGKVLLNNAEGRLYLYQNRLEIETTFVGNAWALLSPWVGLAVGKSRAKKQSLLVLPMDQIAYVQESEFGLKLPMKNGETFALAPNMLRISKQRREEAKRLKQEYMKIIQANIT